MRLVTAENCYYQHDENKWQFYSERLDLPGFGPAGGDSQLTAAQGCELVLETTGLATYILPVPGGEWPNTATTQPTGPVQRVPCFGERAYAPNYNGIERSSALRLAFYRGRQPYQTASDGTYPMLTAGNLDLQGQALGSYSLRLDGAAVLPLKANPYTVTWPVWLSEEQFYQLDMARRVEIDGLHFVVRKISLTFPLRQPAELELVLMPPSLTLP